MGITPGIIHLARAPATQDLMWMMSVPHGAYVFTLMLKSILCLIPNSLLSHLLTRSNNYPRQHIATSVAWLRSQWGIYTSLALAAEETHRIETDTIWDEEVWGAALPSDTRFPYAKLYFLFGKEDAWVARDLRDELIARRGRRTGGDASGEEWKPVMEIDQTGITHDFSIRHAKQVAEKVAGWVGEVIALDEARQK